MGKGEGKNPNGVWKIDMEPLLRVAVGVFYSETENTEMSKSLYDFSMTARLGQCGTRSIASGGSRLPTL